MQKVMNKQSNLFIHYEGGIHDNISSVNYLWDDMEDMIFDASMSDDLKKICDGKHIYLFMKYGALYPINFKMKHLGFWEELREKYKLSISKMEEISYPGQYCETYFGLCELADSNISKIKPILGGDSFLIISELEHTLTDCKNYIQFTNSKARISLSSVINDFCSIGDKIVTVIRGCDGSSLNIFYIT